MDEVEHLRRLLAEEQARRREAESRALAEERRRKEAESLAREERHRREKLEERIAPTDFHTYLTLCHRELFLQLSVQTDPSLSSATGYTKVSGRHYPLHLRPWTDFPQLHEACQLRLESAFGTEKRFLPEFGMEVIKSSLSVEPVAEEEDLRTFEHIAIEDCIMKVMSLYFQTKAEALDTSAPSEIPADAPSQATASRAVPRRIHFRNNPYGLLSADAGDDATADLPAYVPAINTAQQQDAISRGRGPGHGPPPAKRQSSPTRPKLYPDQWCFYIDSNNIQNPVFVIEYKAAHKLRGAMIKTALSSGEEGGLFRGVLYERQSIMASLDDHIRATVDAKKAVAQVFTQAFHYMVDFGLEYCYVTSGEAIILLRIHTDDPRTLFYYLALPKDEAESDGQCDVRQTAVALVLTLTLLALEAPVLTQRWKQDAVYTLQKWPTPYPEMELGKADREYQEDPPGSLCLPPQLPSPAADGGCREPTKGEQKRRDDDSDSDTDFLPPRRLSRLYTSSSTTVSPRNTRKTRSSRPGHDGSGGGGDDRGSESSTRQAVCAKYYYRSQPTQARPYCTQACLIGLRDGGPLDHCCPNTPLHQHGASSTHAISRGQFARLMLRQLAEDLDEDCEALDKYGKFGAIGVLFRLTLRGYGYCIVAKGVQRPHLGRLEREERVYRHLQKQQGELVPVCLGIIPLVHEYWTSSGAHISHMMLLSYAGEPTSKRVPSLPADSNEQIQRLWRLLRGLGVQHGDERARNVVWNPGLQRFLCVDFDCATQQQIRHEGAPATAPAKRQRFQ